MIKNWFPKLLLLCAFILFFGATVAVVLTNGNGFATEFNRLTESLSNILPF